LFPLVYLHGRDQLKNGKGEMLMKLFSFITLAHEKGNFKIDSGTLQRYLGEICWFPYAAKEPYLKWEEVGENSATAYFTQNGITVDGTFNFSPEGKLLSFETQRYYGGDKEAVKRKWFIEILKNHNFQGLLLPSHCRVTWKLPEGDFSWLELQVTQIQYI
jgi:hypothetical protein